MTFQRIRQVKREIRVLGVAARRVAKGARAHRGNLWLDGALMANSDSDDLTTATADMLADSTHSGQVRVILLSRHNLPSEARLDASELYTKVGKPIIILGDGTLWAWKTGGKEIHYTAEGLDRWTAEAVLRASTRECVTPEALRVAALTLSALH